MKTIPDCLLPGFSAQGQEQRGQQLVEDMAIVYEKKMLSQAHQKHTLGGGGEKSLHP